MISKSEVPNEKAKEEPKKKNYCDKDGNCTVGNYPDELNCAHYDRSIMRANCIYRVWFENRCLSPFALVAAREAVEEDH